MSAETDNLTQMHAERAIATEAEAEACSLPVSSLQFGDSPRLGGESDEHLEVLAATEGPLPPILVHRQTLQVIDGMHRLRVALLRGNRTITVRFFDGSQDDAFVSAVKSNIEHGLPLTLADRQAAAERIVASYPLRSDRWVAAITGLAAGTVAAIRRRTTPGDHQSGARVGRDGRVRPLRSADGRRVARHAITQHPEASIREIAKLAGISPATVLDVRERMNRGEDPVPPTQRPQRSAVRQPKSQPARSKASRLEKRDRPSLIRTLRKDPSLRFTESGRTLLCWLGAVASGPGQAEDLLATVPPHCAYLVAALARSFADEWLQFATQLEQGNRQES
jgi:ParB-like chromosome segregation protein Spo0J